MQYMVCNEFFTCDHELAPRVVYINRPQAKQRLKKKKRLQMCILAGRFPIIVLFE